MKVAPHKSSTGMDANTWAMLTYIITIVLGWITYAYYVAWLYPLIIYLTEKDSEYVKFHAMQAVALYVINAIIKIVIDIIVGIISITVVNSVATLNLFTMMSGGLGGAVAMGTLAMVSGVLTLIFMVFAIIATIRSYQYEQYVIPMASGLASKFAAALNKNK